MGAVTTGSAFEAQTAGLGLGDYNAAVRRAVDAGAWVVWPMTIVQVAKSLAGGRDIRFVVSEDYFAIGTEADFVRVPLDALIAQELADRLGFVLPTPRMVDLIWLAAPTKVEPLTGGQLSPPVAIGTHEQDSPPAFWRHSRAVDAQLAGRTGLTAGHKKDVVRSNRLAEQQNRVCIYGWHRQSPNAPDCSKLPTLPGLCPIQGVSIVHEDTYRDYAHGVRMVSPMAILDGEAVALDDMLSSSDVGPILNQGTPLTVLRQPPHKGSLPIGAGGCGGGQGLVATSAFCASLPPPPRTQAGSGPSLLTLAALGVAGFAGYQLATGKWRI